MSKLSQLKSCVNVTQLAILMGTKPKALAHAIHGIPDHEKYFEFKIPKKSGGSRLIQSPVPPLKKAQKLLAKVLYACLLEIEADANISERNALSHGFSKGRSVITNASRHRNRRYVFNVDLEDFFPSIHFGRVRGFFAKNRHFELNDAVATAIAQLACHNGALPQGSPCSPVISNLLAHVLDVHLGRFAAAQGCSYTRYADDLTFSTNRKDFPPSIGMPVEGSPHQWTAGDGLVGRVYRAGFRINNKKTRLQYRNSRQSATGLVVNDKVNVPNEYYRQARTMVHHLTTSGTFYFQDQTSPATFGQLRGMLSFLFLVRGSATEHKRIPIKNGENEKQARPAFYRLYKRFLDFIYFHANDRPTIICEGKTDNTYLSEAIISLAKRYPGLFNGTADKDRFLVKFFKYTDTSSAIQDLGGGTGDLSRFIYGYDGAIRQFSAPGKRNPVIIIVDNDSGSSNIWTAIKKVADLPTAVTGLEPFYHVINNLYVIPIPKIGTTETRIEDFFDSTDLGIIVNGRKFNPDENTFDPKIHYPKSTFADEVKKRRGRINFTNFIPILDRIVQVQADYTARLAALP
ncbi:retron Ec67 family RNA-directed DNA polymerase/endonuclease [Phenylobacterium sp.]|uniref:retron Ec67 family RNA-directed DNA polymerase/endonuclease n=1 Tax=Phenylobacterium sp. TaxID=1871053 RepID=UPI0035B4976A